MPMLSCSAITCVYNKDELCSKGDIMVGGKDAHAAAETCCESFKERTGQDYSNSEGCGCKTIQVDCEAHHCIYNENCKCDAAKIGITGSYAAKNQDTACGSFRCD